LRGERRLSPRPGGHRDREAEDGYLWDRRRGCFRGGHVLRGHYRRLHRALVSAVLEVIARILDAEEFGSVITVVGGPAIGAKAVLDSEGVVVAGSLPQEIVEDITEDARSLMSNEQHRNLEYGDHSVFIETLAPPPDLLVFGAVHIGQALASIGTQMGYRVTVVDSRAPFVTEERFPTAHRLLVGWPKDLIDQITFDRRTW